MKYSNLPSAAPGVIMPFVGGGIVTLYLSMSGAGILTFFGFQGQRGASGPWEDIAMDSSYFQLSGRGLVLRCEDLLGPSGSNMPFGLTNYGACIITLDASQYTTVRAVGCADKPASGGTFSVLNGNLRTVSSDNLAVPVMTGPETLYHTPRVLLSTGVQSYVTPPGTVAADGSFTLTSAATGASKWDNFLCWLWLPAGAVVGGAAGMYLSVLSTATSGFVLANYYHNPAMAAMGAPNAQPMAVPKEVSDMAWAALNAMPKAVGSGVQWARPTDAYIPMGIVTIPEYFVGKNGSLDITCMGQATAGAAAKFLELRIANTNLGSAVAGRMWLSDTSGVRGTTRVDYWARGFSKGVSHMLDAVPYSRGNSPFGTPNAGLNLAIYVNAYIPAAEAVGGSMSLESMRVILTRND
jgi:hypothetical protein